MFLVRGRKGGRLERGGGRNRCEKRKFLPPVRPRGRIRIQLATLFGKLRCLFVNKGKFIDERGAVGDPRDAANKEDGYIPGTRGNA